jgi:hypothetical protein
MIKIILGGDADKNGANDKREVIAANRGRVFIMNKKSL